MLQKLRLKKLKARFHSLIYILVFLGSFSSPIVHAEVYYGVLRGSQLSNFKSPYAGTVEFPKYKEGNIYNNHILFHLSNVELFAKKKLFEEKISFERNKQKRLYTEYENIKKGIEMGFYPKNEAFKIEDEIHNIDILIKSLIIEKDSVSRLINVGSPKISKPFIVRNLFVENGRHVDSGDNIITIEYLDNFYIDVKIDPVIIRGDLKTKEITFKSLVKDVSGRATVVKTVRAPLNGNENKSSGLRLITLLIHSDPELLVELLDTVFEIKIND
ncbi:TPA: hypothetical protein N2G37_001150 [Salmonella enterica]|uniref:hypothetical protein n=1 Tax=Salmonella enterica TaxID=28901 RepID=UPI0015C65C45|nr:hypothetical protein [Salmonella enterica]EIU5772584.1 hypothetical protein [Salmonella enterica]NYA57905.1 hypothetical protein [Salmonella enterica]HCL5273593.1 hypothetical protein [Salmonella enterica]